MLTARRRRASLEQARSERNQGRGERHGLARPRPARLQLPAVRRGRGDRRRAARARSTTLLAARARVADLYRERLGAIEGLVLPCEDEGAERRSWFVYVVQLPRGRRPRRRDRRARASAGIASKAYLPVHPPPAVLPRALRLPRRRVPGRRGRRRAVARAAVLHRDGASREVERVCAARSERARPPASRQPGSARISVSTRARRARSSALAGPGRRRRRPVILFHDLLGEVAQLHVRASLLAADGRERVRADRRWACSRPRRWCCRSAATPDSRLYPRSRGALAGWGVSLYLLGAMLLIQIGAIAQSW